MDCCILNMVLLVLKLLFIIAIVFPIIMPNIGRNKKKYSRTNNAKMEANEF